MLGEKGESGECVRNGDLKTPSIILDPLKISGNKGGTQKKSKLEIPVDEVREVWSCCKRDLCLEEEDGLIFSNVCKHWTLRDPTLHSEKNSRNETGSTSCPCETGNELTNGRTWFKNPKRLMAIT